MATTPRTPLPISVQTQEKLIRYIEEPIKEYSNFSQLRARWLWQDRQYCRELDWTARHLEARRKNLAGDPQAMQNIIVPVNEPLVESALSYLTELYLSGYPIFPVVTPPELEQVGTKIESLVGESAIQFQYALHLQRALRDGLKHNILCVDTEWQRRVAGATYPASMDSAKPGEKVMWEGQAVTHVSLYNAYFDTRVMPCEVAARGDFAGYCQLFSYVQLKQLFADLEASNTMNATDAFKTTKASINTDTGEFTNFFVPRLNPEMNISPNVQANWLQWVGLENGSERNYADTYEVMKLYVRLIPADFGIPSQGSRNHPQIWKFYIVNKKVVIYAKQVQSADDSFPLVVGQVIDDGHGWQTKSFLDGAATYQSIASSLYNSGLVSQRRKVYDRLFYDPSRINKKDINNVDPVARIAVKTEAYGTDLSNAVWAQPYRDDGVAQIFATGREIIDMADVSTGSNRVQRGQFQRGNKTRYEFQETMGNSNARPRLMATVLESSFFQPLKYKIKIGVVDHQKVLKFLDRNTGQEMEITPSELRTTLWQFKLGDGMLPVDKMVNMEALQLAIQLSAAQPAMAMEYDLIGMSAYVSRLF